MEKPYCSCKLTCVLQPVGDFLTPFTDVAACGGPAMCSPTTHFNDSCVRNWRRQYWASVTFMDEQVGGGMCARLSVSLSLCLSVSLSLCLSVSLSLSLSLSLCLSLLCLSLSLSVCLSRTLLSHLSNLTAASLCSIQFVDRTTGQWITETKAGNPTTMQDLLFKVIRNPLNANRTMCIKGWVGPTVQQNGKWPNNTVFPGGTGTGGTSGAPTTPAGKRAAAALWFNQALATFLLVADDNTWFSYSWFWGIGESRCNIFSLLVAKYSHCSPNTSNSSHTHLTPGTFSYFTHLDCVSSQVTTCPSTAPSRAGTTPALTTSTRR